MSFFQLPSKADIVRGLNSANGTSFLLSDLAFSNPKVVSGSWQGIASTRNTAIRVTAASASYQGSKVIQYNRLDLGQLANLHGIERLAAWEPKSTWDLLDPLAFYTGIKFDQTDLQNLPITLNADGSGQAQLSADPNSLGWIGSVVLSFVKGGVGLDSALTTTNLDGLNYPVSDAVAPPTSAIQGPVYLYPYDFTSWQNTLLTYAPGVLSSNQADFLVAAIKAVDVGSGKSNWVNDSTSTAWNLNGASIVSNGLNNPNTLPTNPAYKYVLQLQLAANQTTPSGMLYLHYNDPFDPNDF